MEMHLVLGKNTERKEIPLFTFILAAVNVLAFLAVEAGGSSLDSEYMIRVGAMYEPAFWGEQEYYRVITSFFLHFGIEHLINNMISLLVLGYALEQSIGKVWFCFIYMISGVFSGLVSVGYHLYKGQEVVSCGASGAIYGLMGALMVLLLIAYNRGNLRLQIPRFALYIAISLYSGAQDPGIDNAAHAGGFAGGAVLCIIMCIMKKIFTERKERVSE